MSNGSSSPAKPSPTTRDNAMLRQSAHLDTFARDNLPVPETWPDLLLDGFDYPDRLNAAYELTDAMVEKGFGDHTALIGNGRQRTYKELADWTIRLAHALVQDLGVKPGNRVLIRSASCSLVTRSSLSFSRRFSTWRPSFSIYSGSAGCAPPSRASIPLPIRSIAAVILRCSSSISAILFAFFVAGPRRSPCPGPRESPFVDVGDKFTQPCGKMRPF